MFKVLLRKLIVPALSIMIFTILFPLERAVSKENKTILLASSRPSGSPINTWWKLIYQEVFNRLGLKLEVQSFPLARASNVADYGLVDGETIRVFAYANEHPNLIRVEEPTIPLTLVAYTVKPKLTGLNGWESLKGKKIKAEYARGAYICKTNLEKVIKRQHISNVTQAIQGLRKLVTGRTDIYIDDENVILPLLNSSEFKGRIKVAGIMDQTPLHLYMHKRHAELVPKLEVTIKEIKKDGVIEKCWYKAFGFNKNRISSF